MINSFQDTSGCRHRVGGMCMNREVGEHIADGSVQADWFCSQCSHFSRGGEDEE